MKIIYKNTSELIPYVNNTRTHSDEQVQQIASSIKEFGFTNPVLLDEKDGVIAGHGRIMAAKLLKMDEVPTITLEGLSEAQIKAYIIADNKLALNAGWDEELLKVEIESLQEMNFDIDLLGFSIDELDDLGIGDIDLDLDTDKADEVPELEENPVIKLGDLIELGHNYQHRLLCGDSTSEDDVRLLMDGKKADMVFTDPPYNVDFKGQELSNTTKNGKVVLKHKGANTKHEKIKNDNLGEDFEEFIIKVLSNIINLEPKAWYFSFCDLKLDELLIPLKKVGFTWKSIIIWRKNQASLSGKDYKSRYEPIVYGCKENAFFGERYKEEDIWDFQRTLKNDLHPTMKPVPLIEKAIYNSSKTHEIIVDLFGGSGTTMIASENISRHSRLMELDEKYAQVIIQRYVDYTSNPMIKINGVSYDWHEYKEKNSVA